MTDTTLNVPDISCDHCKSSIESAVGALEGVARVEVDIARRTVDISYDEQSVTPRTLVGAIEDEGYEVAS